mgnify:FL=1
MTAKKNCGDNAKPHHDRWYGNGDVLNFTPDFCTYIAGVQGRYFLPFLPLLVLAVKNKTIYIRKKMDYGLAAAVFAWNLWLHLTSGDILSNRSIDGNV